VVERAHGIRVREEREAADATGEARALRATAIEAGRPRGAATSPEAGREPETPMFEEAARRAERVAAAMRRVSMETRDELLRPTVDRYRVSSRLERGRIIGEFTATTGYHRKHAMRLLRNGSHERPTPRAPRRL